MKNISILKKVLLVILFITIVLITTNVNAAVSFSVNKTSTSIEKGKTTTFTITGTNVTGRVDITSSNTSVATVSPASVWLDNNTATITITAKSAGSATISVNGEIASLTPGSDEEGTCSRTVSVKIKEPPSTGGTSTGNTSTGGSNNNSGTSSGTTTTKPSSGGSSTTNNNNKNNNNQTTTKIPTFKTVNQKVYTTGKVNLRASWSTSSSIITSIPTETEITRIGTSTDVAWSKVKYNGKTGYVSNNYITTTAPKEEEPKQNPEEEPKQNPEEQPEETINEETVTLGLQSLEIKGITLSPEFKTDVMEYTATLEDTNVTELEVNAVPVDENFKIEIAGNTELKDGENVITILVKDEEADKSVVYQITVAKEVAQETASLENQDLQTAELEAKQQEANKKKIIIGIIAGLVLIGIIVLIVVYLKGRNTVEYDDSYSDYDIDLRKKGKH